MKLRLTREYNPLTNSEHWYVHERVWWWWETLSGPYCNDEESARRLFERLKRTGSERQVKIVEQI